MTITDQPPLTEADRARALADDGPAVVAREVRKAAQAEYAAERRMYVALAACDLAGLPFREVAQLLATPAQADGVHHKTAAGRVETAWPEVMGDAPRPARRRGGPRRLSANERVEAARVQLAAAIREAEGEA